MKNANVILILLIGSMLSFSFTGNAQQGEAKKQASPAKPKAAAPASEVKTGTNIGDMAPDLTYSNPEGKQISLSSFRGKVVLLDFWASWCRPCRMENPNVVSAYNKFKGSKFKNGNGFTVFGVSLDMNKDAWLKAIMDDKLAWDHISDLGYWNSAPAATYGVRSIPSNFLIDGSGKIIGVNLRGPMLEQELEKIKMAQ